jgi:hypothetical protein
MFGDRRGGVRGWPALVVACGLLAQVTACSLTRDVSKTARTGIEQLLLTQALERSLVTLSLPLPDGAPVKVDAASLTGGDEDLVKKLIEDRLARLGYRLPEKPEDAIYRVRVVVQAFGTEQGTTFFGMPPVQSVLLPFSLPELALYKNVRQRAVVRLSLDVHRIQTGQYITTSPWYEGTTYNNEYTFLLIFSANRNDLMEPEVRDLLATR